MSDSQRLLDQAHALQQTGQTEAAEWLYRAVLALDADHAAAHHYLGLIECDTGQPESGLAHLQAAVAAAPASDNYRLALATELAQQQRPVEALEVLTAAPTPLTTTTALELQQQLTQILNPHQAVTAAALLNGNAAAADTAAETELLVTLADGLRMWVPADIHALTTYVLLEQGDWHERTELALVRRLIAPGMVIVDGGAQHGVYSLTAAQQLQGSGAVLALEPTARAAQLLAHSVTENGFDALITVLPLGLAAQSGTAEISVYADRKPNNLDGQRRTEIVNQLTLDALMHVPQWQSGMNVDFLRLNVDGLAASVLFTGREFFAAQSPLLMLRVTGGAAIPSALLEAMKLLKMTLYRIVPGLNALVAVNVAQSLDNHQRNLFACRAERAQQLQARGLLLNAAEAQS
ncbi:hypothetical protein CKO12_13085 [Chromatium okenii]|uniref:FkbM family methyltransferase n=1 Tax=Chromatium okenii TaxID=61644 RepID=UPI0019084B68|nr:hypothetical protein [Chromatium okenii]